MMSKSTLITIELSTQNTITGKFIGHIFRGWLGFVLKCNPAKACTNCDECLKCSYFMIFKEQIDVKPFSLLSFKDSNKIKAFIRIYGERRKFAPQILTQIKSKESSTHFGGSNYSIDSIEAKNMEIKCTSIGCVTKVIFISPMHLMRNRQLEIIPSFNTLIRSCVRSYNRFAKYYDLANYPYHAPPEVMEYDAEIMDFDVKSFDYVHLNMNNNKIPLSGIEGWIEYNTADAPAEIGKILGMGETLQIGKHTSYGFGGFIILNKEEIK